jgi:hypothetical protein
VIEVKALHENLEIEQYGFEKTYNNFSLHASLSDSRRPETEGLQYNATGGLYLSGYNQADFYVTGEIDYQTGKWGRFGAWGEWSKREPSWQQRYYLSPSLTWKNDFNKEGKLEFGVDYQWKAQELEIGFQWTQLTDYIYFDTASLPKQRSGSLNLATFWVGKQFHFGLFHMDHFVSLQFSQDQAIMPVPTLQLKSSFFIEAFVFRKAMLARIGVDFRYITGFSVYRFNPLINQHFLSSRDESFAPTIDVFLTFRVKTVRFVVKMQNVTQGLFTKGDYGVFPYSLEDDTSAYGLGDPIPDRVKMERVRRVMRQQEEISLEKNEQLVGSELKVLIDRIDSGVAYGRTEWDCPEVDNEVVIDQAEEGFDMSTLAAGSFYHAEITDVEAFDLFAKLKTPTSLQI